MAFKEWLKLQEIDTAPGIPTVRRPAKLGLKGDDNYGHVEPPVNTSTTPTTVQNKIPMVKKPAKLGPKGTDNYGHVPQTGQIPGTVVDQEGKLVVVNPEEYKKHIGSF